MFLFRPVSNDNAYHEIAGIAFIYMYFILDIGNFQVCFASIFIKFA